ncbi:MAG: hypothetical protein IPG04_16685 [Polyangiaceae bacterium]|nr:hypothetical protein [Polyangiaceae bacterium]
MDQEQAELFERVIWVEATLRHFDPETTDVVLTALSTREAALVEGRMRLERALRDAELRHDPELANRWAWETARATAALREMRPTLESVRGFFARSSLDEDLPDLVGWFAVWKNQ